MSITSTAMSFSPRANAAKRGSECGRMSRATTIFFGLPRNRAYARAIL